MALLTEHVRQELQALEAADSRRALRAADPALISFVSNDYLGLADHPEVIAAGQAALAQYSAGAAASRLVAGNHPLYAPLEQAIARAKGQEAALVFGSGYLANLGTITALVGEGDLILADKWAHACIIDGAQLSGATLKRFRHNDLAHAEALLKEHRGQYKNTLIVTEHIFSMDGDKAPIAELKKLAGAYDSWLMVDDAHGLFDAPIASIDLWMGTLSKAAGGYGGYVAAKQEVIDYLLTKARPFIFSTGLPPATCASATKAIEIAQAEPERRARPIQLAQRVAEALNISATESAILPIIVGENVRALALAEALKQRGIQAIAIRPPTVPPNTARLRLTFTAAHTDAQIDQLIAALKAEGVGA
jgi:8-amino-7-oxononanoate synthase